MSVIKGIDVSHHQGTIDWGKVAKAGYRYAILKATEGASYRDPTLVTNAHGAAAAGLEVGAYHFARLSSPPEAQADLFLTATHGLTLDMGLWLDYEDRDTKGTSPKSRTTWAERWVAKVRASQPRVGWYADQGFIASMLPSEAMRGIPLWIAAPSVVTPRTSWYGRPAAIQQVDWHASVPGISGDVDVNVGPNPWPKTPPPPPPAVKVLWRDPKTGDVFQPTGPDSGYHLSPVQLADLTARGWTVIAHPTPTVVTR